ELMLPTPSKATAEASQPTAPERVAPDPNKEWFIKTDGEPALAVGAQSKFSLVKRWLRGAEPQESSPTRSQAGILSLKDQTRTALLRETPKPPSEAAPAEPQQRAQMSSVSAGICVEAPEPHLAPKDAGKKDRTAVTPEKTRANGPSADASPRQSAPV